LYVADARPSFLGKPVSRRGVVAVAVRAEDSPGGRAWCGRSVPVGFLAVSRDGAAGGGRSVLWRVLLRTTPSATPHAKHRLDAPQRREEALQVILRRVDTQGDANAGARAQAAEGRLGAMKPGTHRDPLPVEQRTDV